MKSASTLLWISCLLASITNVKASDTELDRETLKSVKTVYVLVALPTGTGLAGEQIQTDVTGSLRAAGINVSELNRPALSLPCVFVSVNLLKRQDGSWVYEVSLSLNQAVMIVASGHPYMAPTWSASTLAFVPGSTAPEFVETDIEDLTNKFIHAFLAVHARR